MSRKTDESGGAVTINPTSGVMTSVSNDQAGYLTSVAGPEGTIHYVYDAATGREVEAWMGATHSTATTDTLYGYDAQGRLASTTIVRQGGVTATPTTSAIAYYDAVGDSITPSTYYPTVVDTYDADGNVTKVTYPNGTETDTDYSSFWTATGVGGVFGSETITNKRGTTVLSSFVYSFDADRRKISDLEKITDPNEGLTNTALYTWTYDNLSRLMSETYDYNNDDAVSGSTTHTADDYTSDFSYDLNNNRLTEITDQSNDGTVDQMIAYTYNGDNELKTEIGTSLTGNLPTYSTTYGYDYNGSTTSMTRTGAGATSATYTYDSRNRMKTYVTGTTTTTYKYDTDGDMVSEQIGSSAANTYLIDTQSPTGYATRLEQWQSSTLISSYVLSNTGVVGQLSGTTPSFFLQDGEGTIRQITAYTPSSSSTNGHVKGRYDFTGFGVPISFTSTHTANQTGYNSIFQYKGEPFDAQSGMTVMDVRDYQAWLGRFSTQDPTGRFAPGDWDNANLYVAFGGSPLDISDPTGHDLSLGGLLGSIGIAAILDILFFPNTANAPGPRDPVYKDNGGTMAIGAVIIPFITPPIAKLIGAGISALGLGRVLAQSLLSQGVNAVTQLSAGDSVALGEGTIFAHFTTSSGVAGITGMSAADVESMAVGSRYLVQGQILLKAGPAPLFAPEGGGVFVTDLGTDATPGELSQIGVMQSSGSQDYAIQFSQETAFNSGVRFGMARSGIFVAPGNATIKGDFLVTRLH